MTDTIVDTGSPPKPPRDGFLDTLRTIALTRVIIWHTFGTPWISWVIATMPTMFFVAGSLLASTLDRKPLAVMYRSRFKRLLVPYWFFSLTVLTFLSLVHIANPAIETVLRFDQLLPWAVPFVDPTGSTWEAGWASSPLWYLRAYVWLLMLSPILRAGVRRFGSLALLPSLGATVSIEWWLHHPTILPIAPGTWTWLLGDLFLYSFFLMLGFCHYDGAFERLRADGLREWVFIGSVACFMWWAVFPAPTGIINHSFVGLLAVGVAWLALFLLLRPALSKATENSLTGPFVHLFTRRAMTIYMWHSPCIVAGYAVLEIIAPEAVTATVLLPTTVFVVAAVIATGWVEDKAAGRAPEMWPSATRPLLWRAPWMIVGDRRESVVRRHGIGLAVGVALAVIFTGLAVTPIDTAAAAFSSPSVSLSTSSTDLPPAPSGRPNVADFGEAEPGPVAVALAATTSDASAEFASDSDLTEIVSAWLVERDVAGARVAISMPDGSMRRISAGEYEDASVSTEDVVPLTSATKSITAAIILGLVDQGLLELDEPIPLLAAVPEFTHSVTLRQVLNHTAGLAPYQETAGFVSSDKLSALDGVRLSALDPLQWEPGTQRGYSNAGYLLLGLLAEQVGGRSFTELIEERTQELGMSSFVLDETARRGWVGWSAGGLDGTVEDLATWGAALYRDGGVLSESALSNMVTLDSTFGIGLGAFPVCPCGTDDTGARWYTSIGHNGGEVSVQYAPEDDTVIAISVTESLWTPFLSEQDVYDLLADLRDAG